MYNSRVISRETNAACDYYTLKVVVESQIHSFLRGAKDGT